MISISPAILRAEEPFVVSQQQQEQRDLFVLKYMARKVYSTLVTFEEEPAMKLPSLSIVEERRSRNHRIMIYNPDELITRRNLAFVGFVSGQQTVVNATVFSELLQADQKMVEELASIPGFFGYASLELRPGHWYNLVLLEDYELKSHLYSSETHRYAAQHLAPRYYDWIRLHSGTIQGGLKDATFVLQRTKFYQFPGGLHSVSQKFTTPTICN